MFVISKYGVKRVRQFKVKPVMFRVDGRDLNFRPTSLTNDNVS